MPEDKNLQPPSSLADILSHWRADYVDKLVELQKTRLESRTRAVQSDQDTLAFLLDLLDALDSFEKTYITIDQALTDEDTVSYTHLRAHET